jgi:hypothetical protein
VINKTFSLTGNENLATYWDKFIIGADFGKLTNILGTPRPLRMPLLGFLTDIIITVVKKANDTN